VDRRPFAGRLTLGCTTAIWSYTPTLGGPLLPGAYTIVAQAIDTNRTFSGASNTTTVVIV
jgi:hypothetical protein